MSFGRIMYWATPENKRGLRHTWVPIRWFTTFFVSWDMASFFITCIGVFVLIANTTKKDLTPEQQISGLEMTYRILRVAFVWQIIFFGLFSIIAIRFMLASKAWKYDWPEGGSSQWRKIAWVVNGAAILITVSPSRIRMIENRADCCSADHYTGAFLSPSIMETTISKITSGRFTCSTSFQSFVSII